MKAKLQKRRLLALLLSVAMVISMMPGLAFAERITATPGDGESPEEAAVKAAQVGDVQYDTLEAAINAATDGAEIKLLKNVDEVFGVAKTGTDEKGKNFTFYELEKNLTIDLNQKTFTMTNTYSFWLRNNRTLKIKNGALKATSLPNGTQATFNIQKGCSMYVDNVRVDTNGAFLYPKGDAAEVNVNNSTVECGVYAVGTNAATADNYDVIITLTNSTFNSKYGYQNNDSDSCPILVNVPCELNMTNCNVKGTRQGVVVRGGTANISGCSIETTATYTAGINKYWNDNWESGDEVPMAALVVGNRSVPYKYPATCKVVDTVVTAPETVKAIYAYEMSEEGRKVTLDVTGTKTSVTGQFLRDEGNPSTVIVTGGSFSTDPKEFVSDGYVVNKSGEKFVVNKYVPPYIPPTDKPEPPKVDEDGKVDVPVNKPDENGKVEADVSDSAVNDALDKVIADVEAGNKENVVVEIKVNTDSKAEAVDVKVDSASIDKIAKTKNATLKVESNVGALELDNDVLKEISKNAGGGKVNISIEKPKVENMPAKQQETIKEIAKKGMVFNLSITAGDKKISNLGGIATLSVDYNLPENEVAEGVRVYFVNDNGEIKPVDAHYVAKSKKIVMSTDHFSVYAVSYVNVPTKVGILRTANDKGRASLRWSRATNDPEGYRVYRSATKDGKYKPIAWVKNGKAKTYKEKAKKTNKTYYYKVRAYKNMDGKKVWGGYSPIKVIKF
ncbi:MAG: hypothetical protein RR967_01805 [Anaerovoracaceae bacterium]